MEGSFGFPNIDKCWALFTCYFVNDISSLAIHGRSYVIRDISVFTNVFFGDALRGKGVSGTEE
jgi:hypothetical protein